MLEAGPAAGAGRVIVGRVVLVDPRHVDLVLIAVASASVADRDPAPREAFTAGVAALPEVTEVWRIAGQADVLPKVAMRDLAALDAFDHRLTATFELKGVSVRLALERVATPPPRCPSTSTLSEPLWSLGRTSCYGRARGGKDALRNPASLR